MLKSEEKKTEPNMICEISIIMPVFNAEKSIELCVNSVLSQTFSNWHLIIVDDGSTDDSAKLLDQYAFHDSRISVIHKKNAGVSSSRNMGIDFVDTEYFVCIDSDDSVEPDYLFSMIQAKEKYPQAGHIWCGFKCVSNESGEEAKLNLVSEHEEYSVFDRSDYMYLFDGWFTQMPWHHLYCTSIVKDNKIKFDETMSLAEDIFFNLDYIDCVENTDIVVINQSLYNYVIDQDNSLSSKYREDLLNIIEKSNAVMRDFLIKWNINEQEWGRFYNMVFYNYEKAMLNTFSRFNTMSKREKILYNNEILRKPEFKEALSKRTCHVHPLYLFAYKLKDYRMVLFVRKLVAFKHKLRKVGSD